MNKLQVKAMSKINLGLDVVRKREDGYHEVSMIMQTLNLYDTLTFEKCQDKGIFLKADRKGIPTDKRNLIYRVAELLIEKYNINGGIRISLQKNIPVAAGMAGGSTDAAAVFIAMNKLYALGMTLEEMKEEAVKIGADVPYCIEGGTALAEGIGEKLTRLKALPFCHILIAKPDLYVSTKHVYETLHANELVNHPDIAGQVAAIKDGNLNGILERMDNVLERVTKEEHPIIAEIEQFMKEHGAENAMMSGSGPTVFGIFKNKWKMQTARKKLEKTGLAKQIYSTCPVDMAQEITGEE